MPKIILFALSLLLFFSGCATPPVESTQQTDYASLRDAALADYLVGTWEPTLQEEFKTSHSTFYPDGTWIFTGLATDAAAKEGMPPKIEAEGTYRVEGARVFETAHKLSPALLPLPHTKSFVMTDISRDEHVSTEIVARKGTRYRRVKDEADCLHPFTKATTPTPLVSSPSHQPVPSDDAPLHPFTDAIPSAVLTLAGKTKFKPGEITLLTETARRENAAGALAAVILYRLDKQKYHDVFRARCAYDYDLQRTVMPKEEIDLMIGDLIAKMINPSELEASFQIFHFFRSTGFIYLREDGTEFLTEKMFSAAAFTTFAAHCGDKDVMRSTMELSFESYRR